MCLEYSYVSNEDLSRPLLWLDIELQWKSYVKIFYFKLDTQKISSPPILTKLISNDRYY